MHERRVMRIAERAMQWVGTVAGVAAGCVWGDACVAEAVAGPVVGAPPAQSAPSEQAAGGEGISAEGLVLTVSGAASIVLGTGALAYAEQDQPGWDIGDPILGGLGVAGLALGACLTTAGVVVLVVASPDAEEGPRVQAVAGPTWIGVQGAF